MVRRRDQAQTDAGAGLQAHVATGGDNTLDAVSARRDHGQRRACRHIHGAGAVDRTQQRHVRQRTCRCRGANRQAIGAGVQPAACDQFQVDAIADVLAAAVNHQHHTRTGSGRNAPGGTQLQQRLRQRADPRTGGLHAASNGNQFGIQRNALGGSDADAGVHHDIAASIEHSLTRHRHRGRDRQVGRNRHVHITAQGGGDACLAALHGVHAASGQHARERHILEAGDGQASAWRQVHVSHVNTRRAGLERPVQHRHPHWPVHRTDAATGGDAHSLGLHIQLGRLAIHIAPVSDQRHMALQGLHVVHRHRRTGTHIDLAGHRGGRTGEVHRARAGVHVQVILGDHIVHLARGERTDRQQAEVPAADHVCAQRQGAGHIEPQVVATVDHLLNLQRSAVEHSHRENQFGVGLDATHPLHRADGGGARRSQKRILRKLSSQLVGGETQRHSGAGGAARVHLQQQVDGRNQAIGGC